MEGDETVAIILNKTDVNSLSIETFEEMGMEGKKVQNIITGKQSDWQESIEINANGVTLLTTKMN